MLTIIIITKYAKMQFAVNDEFEGLEKVAELQLTGYNVQDFEFVKINLNKGETNV